MAWHLKKMQGLFRGFLGMRDAADQVWGNMTAKMLGYVGEGQKGSVPPYPGRPHMTSFLGNRCDGRSCGRAMEAARANRMLRTGGHRLQLSLHKILSIRSNPKLGFYSNVFPVPGFLSFLSLAQHPGLVRRLDFSMQTTTPLRLSAPAPTLGMSTRHPDLEPPPLPATLVTAYATVIASNLVFMMSLLNFI